MNELAYNPQSAWKAYASPEERQAMRALAERYVDFLSECKTERETVAWVERRLRGAGFAPGLDERGGFTQLHGKALFAVRRGRRSLSEGFHLISAHTDSPRLDLKQRPLIEQVGVGQAKTHYYGGLRKYQWLARPLALHGVVALQNGDIRSVVIGEKQNDPVFTIEDLLPHLAKKQSEKTVADAFEAEKLNIIIGHEPLEAAPEDKAGNARTGADESREPAKEPVKAHILKLLHERFAIREEDLLSAELQVVPAGPARFVGLDSALVGGYGQDDRICVFTALEAFLSAADPEHSCCLIFWDKEEIGSDGSTGASSRFFEYCVRDMAEAWEPESSFGSLMLASRALSADVHAALDPDWQELHEKQNSALMGYGPSFSKFTGSRGKYGANDAHPEYIAWLRGVLAARAVPWQMAELGKVDLGGGGTVALFLAAYGLDVIDVGPALLGMHSPFELASVADLYASLQVYRAFFEAGR
ncbi:MAG: aminopeptidase [Desulfovibrionaceae bacterium]|nr:aminopeptidase [Desulfovibrionaceae bacterium]